MKEHKRIARFRVIYQKLGQSLKDELRNRKKNHGKVSRSRNPPRTDTGTVPVS